MPCAIIKQFWMDSSQWPTPASTEAAVFAVTRPKLPLKFIRLLRDYVETLEE